MSRVVLTIGALGAFIVGIVQFRHGIVPLLDTVTYWSGAEAFARGDAFRTTLAPSFSNFSALEVLDRGGSLPFVDFPVGYPVVAGTLGAVLGVRRAMEVLVLGALAATAMSLVVGGRARPGGDRERTDFLLAAIGVLVVASPTMRLVTQGALSEPLFCATVLWLVVALARYRQGSRWLPVPVLVVAASLLRFLGAPLAVLAGWERYRRTGRVGGSLFWTGMMMLPATFNIVLANLAGGGHGAGWRGIDRLDVETFVRSVGGWFDGRQGDIRRTYFTLDGPSWWSWPVAVGWLLLVAVAVIATVRRSHSIVERFVQRLPITSELALTAAAIMSAGLLAGIMGFDALVIADNRLMLPSGVLTIAALAWWMASWPQRSLVTWATVVLWAVTAVRPWQVTDRFSDRDAPSALATTVTGLSEEVAVIVTNDADLVHWETGRPAVYAPMPVKPLTGDVVDVEPLYRGLPCALLRNRGAVVINDQATFSVVDVERLDAEVESGRLTSTGGDGATVYLPTSTACAPSPE